MGRKKKQPDAAATPKPTPKPTDVIRVWAEIGRMASIISSATGESVADIVSPLCLEGIRKRYHETVRRLNDEVDA